MYERLDILLKKNGVTPYKLAKDIGISQSSLSEWKRGNSIPKYDKLVKIAGYFNVSVNYLTGQSDDEQPAEADDNKELLDKLMTMDKLMSMVKEKLAAPEWSDEQAKQNLELFNALTADKKQEALRYLRYLVSIQEAEKQ
jgi:transcriptional regulator with XRE-family HTH domain